MSLTLAQDEMVGPAKGKATAWAAYNATNNTIMASYNVSSVTNVSTGNTKVNFANALPSSNFTALGVNTGISGTSYSTTVSPSAKTTTYVQFNTTTANAGAAVTNANFPDCEIVVFGG